MPSKLLLQSCCLRRSITFSWRSMRLLFLIFVLTHFSSLAPTPSYFKKTLQSCSVVLLFAVINEQFICLNSLSFSVQIHSVVILILSLYYLSQNIALTLLIQLFISILISLVKILVQFLDSCREILD